MRVKLPAGFIGNPTAMPACPRKLNVPSNKQAGDGGFDPNEFCPLNSIVGIAEVKAQYLTGMEVRRFIASVFNRVPPPGVAAQFAFSFLDAVTTLDAHVRSDGDYGVELGLATRCSSRRCWGAR